jgi:hypothetical protein
MSPFGESIQDGGKGPRHSTAERSQRPVRNPIWTTELQLKTDVFEHRQVKPHFINPCCLGEDFAAWLKKQIAALEGYGFRLSEIIQEDYGWGFWASHRKDPFWVALSYLGDGPQEAPAQWIISVTYDPGLNLLRRLLHKPDR